jgi:hypothetical protein
MSPWPSSPLLAPFIGGHVIRIKGMILEFCPYLLQRVYPIDKSSNNAMNARNESSKQCDEDHHASNLSLTILDEHKNLHNDSLHKIDNGSAIPIGMLHAATQLFFNLKF